MSPTSKYEAFDGKFVVIGGWHKFIHLLKPNLREKGDEIEHKLPRAERIPRVAYVSIKQASKILTYICSKAGSHLN